MNELDPTTDRLFEVGKQIGKKEFVDSLLKSIDQYAFFDGMRSNEEKKCISKIVEIIKNVKIDG